MTNSHIPPSGVYMELLLKRSGGVWDYYFISGSFLFGHTLPLVYDKTMEFLVDTNSTGTFAVYFFWTLNMERTEPPPLSTSKQLVSEVDVQTAKPKWFDGVLNGSLVLIGLTFFLYMWF